MIKVIKNKYGLYLVWLTMIVFISVGVVTTKYLSLASLVIFLLYAMLNPISDVCVLLFGLLPYANVFKLSAGTTSFFTVCEIIVATIALYKNKKIKSKFLVSLFLFIVYIFITGVRNFNLLGNIKIIVGFCLIYLFMLMFEKKDVINVAYLLSASTILMMLLSMNSTYFKFIEPYLVDMNYLIDSSGHASEIMRMSGFLGDPNYCGVLIVMAVALLCVLYYYKQIKTEFWVFIALLIPLGFFTYSKSYFLCIAGLVAFLILFVLFPKHKGWAIVSVVAMIVLIFMILNGRIEVINLIFERFTTGDLTTGRSLLNTTYLEYIWNHPLVFLFGEGINTDRFVGASNNVHNVYIESLFKLGVVGCCLYLSTLSMCVNTRGKCPSKRRIANYFPMIFLLILYYALAGITMYEFPFYLSIAFLAVNLDLLDKKADKYNLERR